MSTTDLKKINFDSMAQFLNDLNRNFAVIQSSPLYKGIPGEEGSPGDMGLRGSRGSIFMFVKFENFIEYFSTEITSASQINLDFLNSKISNFEDKQKLLKALQTTELINGDIVVLTNSMMMQYDISIDNFIDTKIAFNKDENVLSSIESTIESYVKYYVDNNPTILGLTNVFQTYPTISLNYKSTNNTLITRNNLNSSIYVPYIEGYSSSGVVVDSHKYFGFFDTEFNKTETGTIVFGSTKDYIDKIQNTVSTSVENSYTSDYAPGIDNLPSMVIIQNDGNSGILFGLKTSSTLKNYASLYKDIDGNVILKSDAGKNDGEFGKLILNKNLLEFSKNAKIGNNLEITKDLMFFGNLTSNQINVLDNVVRLGKTSSDSLTIDSGKIMFKEFGGVSSTSNTILTVTDTNELSKKYSILDSTITTENLSGFNTIILDDLFENKIVTANYLEFIKNKINNIQNKINSDYYTKSNFTDDSIENLTVNGNINFKKTGVSYLYGSDINLVLASNNLIVNSAFVKFTNYNTDNVLVVDSSKNISKTYYVEKDTINFDDCTPNSPNNFVTSKLLSDVLKRLKLITGSVDPSSGDFWSKSQFISSVIPSLYLTSELKTPKLTVTNYLTTTKITDFSYLNILSNFLNIESSGIIIKQLAKTTGYNTVLTTDNNGALQKTYQIENSSELTESSGINNLIPIQNYSNNKILTSNYLNFIIEKINKIISTTSVSFDNVWKKSDFTTNNISSLKLNDYLTVEKSVNFVNGIVVANSTNISLGKNTTKININSNDITFGEFPNKILSTNNEGKLVGVVNSTKTLTEEELTVNDIDNLIPEITTTNNNTNDVQLSWIVKFFNNIKTFLSNVYNKTETEEKINEEFGKQLPIGTIVMWAQAQIPTGWAECKDYGSGGTVSGVTINNSNAFVYNEIVYTIPKLSGNYIKASSEYKQISESSNEKILTTQNLPIHNHNLDNTTVTGSFPDNLETESGGVHKHNYTTTEQGTRGDAKSGQNFWLVHGDDLTTSTADSIPHTHKISGEFNVSLNGVSTNSAGSSTPFNIEPKHVELIYIMKIK